jgi:hypothetical protein
MKTSPSRVSLFSGNEFQAHRYDCWFHAETGVFSLTGPVNLSPLLLYVVSWELAEGFFSKDQISD